jgi:hypothetical protein
VYLVLERFAMILPHMTSSMPGPFDGLSDKEISERLHVGVGTVRNHMMNILI